MIELALAAIQCGSQKLSKTVEPMCLHSGSITVEHFDHTAHALQHRLPAVFFSDHRPVTCDHFFGQRVFQELLREFSINREHSRAYVQEIGISRVFFPQADPRAIPKTHQDVTSGLLAPVVENEHATLLDQRGVVFKPHKLHERNKARTKHVSSSPDYEVPVVSIPVIQR